MNNKVLFGLSVALLLGGLIALAAGWHGNAGVSMSLPLSGSAVTFCGSAKGGWAAGGIVGGGLGLVGLLVAMVRGVVNRGA